MPRTKRLIALLAAAVTAAVAAPGSASASDGDWTPAPTPPWDAPAGSRCAFAVHMEPLEDEVMGKVLARHPDGSVEREAFTGKLIVRYTNLDTGATADADVSGDAVVDHGLDGSTTWRWTGAVGMGFAPGMSDHAPGLYVMDGPYFEVVFHADGYREVVHAYGTERDICAELA